MAKKPSRPKPPKPITVDAAYRRVLARVLEILEAEGITEDKGN